MTDSWLTIVTVVYNDRDELRRTLASVASITCPGVRHVVVDGLSQDGSAELARAADHRPSVIVARDEGVYDAMNTGWRAAPDGMVMFLNAGDTFVRSDVVQTLRAVASGSDWVRSNVVVVDGQGRRTRAVQKPRFEPWAFRLGRQPVLHQGALMSRALLAELGGFDLTYRIAADYDLMIRAVEAGHRPRVVDLETVAMQTGGLSTLRWRESLTEKLRIAERGQSPLPRAQILASFAELFVEVGARRALRRSTELALRGSSDAVFASLRQ